MQHMRYRMPLQYRRRMKDYDVDALREQYPILSRKVNGRPLVYLDNAATSQTPRVVVDAVEDGYYDRRANVHRGVHTLSQPIHNSPSLISSNPAIIRSVVDFPHPDGPTKTTSSPFSISRLKFFTA